MLRNAAPNERANKSQFEIETMESLIVFSASCGGAYPELVMDFVAADCEPAYPVHCDAKAVDYGYCQPHDPVAKSPCEIPAENHGMPSKYVAEPDSYQAKPVAYGYEKPVDVEQSDALGYAELDKYDEYAAANTFIFAPEINIVGDDNAVTINLANFADLMPAAVAPAATEPAPVEVVEILESVEKGPFLADPIAVEELDAIDKELEDLLADAPVVAPIVAKDPVEVEVVIEEELDDELVEEPAEDVLVEQEPAADDPLDDLFEVEPAEDMIVDQDPVEEEDIPEDDFDDLFDGQFNDAPLDALVVDEQDPVAKEEFLDDEFDDFLLNEEDDTASV